MYIQFLNSQKEKIEESSERLVNKKKGKRKSPQDIY